MVGSKMQNVAYLEYDDFTEDGILKIKGKNGVNLPVMLLLQGDYCGYCTQFKPEFLKVVNALKNKVFPVTIQMDGKESELSLGKKASKFIPKFKGVPMVVFFVDGKYYSTYEGDRRADALIKYVNSTF